MKTKVIIGISVGLIGTIILINGLINEDKKDDVAKIQNEVQTTTQVTTTNTNTTKTMKKSKKVVKTTKKKTKNKKVKIASVSEYHEYAQEYGNYNTTELICLINLWNHESGWNPNSVNKSSGACGIPQALPCNKIKKSEGSNDWKAQIRWGIKYINYRYNTPCEAWNHFKKKNWY